MQSHWVGALAYADDLCLIFNKIDTPHMTLINRWCQDLGLEISEKSKFFIMNADEDDLEYNISIAEQSIERVYSLKYLGFNVSKDLDYCHHLDERLLAS